jgi:hypothetical protein
MCTCILLHKKAYEYVHIYTYLLQKARISLACDNAMDSNKLKSEYSFLITPSDSLELYPYINEYSYLLMYIHIYLFIYIYIYMYIYMYK